MYLLPQLKKDTGQEAIFNFIKKGKIDESDIFKEYDGLIYTSSENKKVKTQDLHMLRNNIMDLAKKMDSVMRAQIDLENSNMM